jgi:hypothetical protein
LNFLEIENVSLKTDLKSNPASKEKSKTLKRIMKKRGWWRILLKKMIPSLKIRQIIKNRIQRANISTFTPEKLSVIQRKMMYDTYFKEDIIAIEDIIDRKMYWDL